MPTNIEDDMRRIAENRVDPERFYAVGRSERVAVIAAWVGGWLLAAKDAVAREHHDPGDEDRRER